MTERPTGKHTALPWREGNADSGIGTIEGQFRGNWMQIATCGGVSWSYPDGGMNALYRAERDANRPFIVKAVNCHADLVAALEGARPYLRHSLKFYRFQREGHEFWPNREEAEANIRDGEAALAKAKGESL